MSSLVVGIIPGVRWASPVARRKWRARAALRSTGANAPRGRSQRCLRPCGSSSLTRAWSLGLARIDDHQPRSLGPHQNSWPAGAAASPPAIASRGPLARPGGRPRDATTGSGIHAPARDGPCARAAPAAARLERWHARPETRERFRVPATIASPEIHSVEIRMMRENPRIAQLAPTIDSLCGNACNCPVFL